MAKNENTSKSFATIVYPESALKGWEEILVKQGLQFLVSPLHDRDKQEDGTLKKPHYHVLIIFPRKKAKSAVEKIIRGCGAVGCEMVANEVGYARYLTHMDDEDKVKYEEKDVKAYGGIKYEEIVKKESRDEDVMEEVLEFIERNHVMSYYKLSLYCMRYKREWFDLVSRKYSYFIREYMKSRLAESAKMKDVAKELEDIAEKEGAKKG